MYSHIQQGYISSSNISSAPWQAQHEKAQAQTQTQDLILHSS